MNCIAKILISGAIAVFGLVHATQAEEVRLRFAFTTQMDGPGGKAVQKMVDTVKELTKGAVAFDLFPNNQLGGDNDLVAAAATGQIDVAHMGIGAVSTVSPKVQVAALPFVWKSRADYWRVVNGPIGDKLLATLDDKGIKGLAWGSFGERGLITNFPINSPDDLKGRKMRVTQSPIFLKNMEALGGNAVPLPYGEVYTALQQRAVDGVDTSTWAMVEAKFYEVAKNLAITNHIYDSAFFIMNKAKFDSLKPEYQDAIIKGARAGGQVQYDEINKVSDSAVEVMTKAGLSITHPDNTPFQAKVQPVYKFFADQLGKDLIDDVLAAQR